MKFEDRVAKEMTEGMVKAILEEAGYRVIDSGIEDVIRELSCLSGLEYSLLRYPKAMTRLPDFTVMNRSQTEKFLVEVKYRSSWGISLLQSVAEQVQLLGEMVLVSINSHPVTDHNLQLPATYLRCCRLRHLDGSYDVQMRYKDNHGWNHYWKPVAGLISQNNPDDKLWWGMSPLENVFTQLTEDPEDTRRVLFSAIQALAGILKS